MKIRIILSIIALLSLLLTSCGGGAHVAKEITADSLFSIPTDSLFAHLDEYSDTIIISYAKGLKVEYREDGVHVFISNPQDEGEAKATEIVVTKPSSRFICMTALQLGNFEALQLEDKVVGIPSLNYLFSSVVNAQVEQGTTVRIGKEGNFDIESVIAAQPDFIFVSASKHGGYESVKDCGIPLIPHHGYKETNPLGQAEWIKLVGLLTGESRRANAVFASIEQKYNQLKSEVAALPDLVKRPTVVSGRQLRDGWYIVGGRSYMAAIFADAGADYIMKDNEETGGTTLDFELMYAKGMEADFWQTDGSFDGDFTLADLAAEDERYADLRAYKEKRVMFCNLSQTPYRELSPVEPHILLADFVKAFHPEVLPKYQPKYYKLMK